MIFLKYFHQLLLKFPLTPLEFFLTVSLHSFSNFSKFFLFLLIFFIPSLFIIFFFQIFNFLKKLLSFFFNNFQEIIQKCLLGTFLVKYQLIFLIILKFLLNIYQGFLIYHYSCFIKILFKFSVNFFLFFLKFLNIYFYCKNKKILSEGLFLLCIHRLTRRKVEERILDEKRDIFKDPHDILMSKKEAADMLGVHETEPEFQEIFQLYSVSI